MVAAAYLTRSAKGTAALLDRHSRGIAPSGLACNPRGHVNFFLGSDISFPRSNSSLFSLLLKLSEFNHHPPPQFSMCLMMSCLSNPYHTRASSIHARASSIHARASSIHSTSSSSLGSKSSSKVKSRNGHSNSEKQKQEDIYIYQEDKCNLDEWFHCPYCFVGFRSSATLSWHYGYCDEYRRPDSAPLVELLNDDRLKKYRYMIQQNQDSKEIEKNPQRE